MNTCSHGRKRAVYFESKVIVNLQGHFQGQKAKNPTLSEQPTDRFHGDNKWSECSMLRRPPNHPLGVCMYYHFYPSQSQSDMRRVHNGIMKDSYDDIWTWKEVAYGYFVTLMWPLAPNMYSS